MRSSLLLTLAFCMAASVLHCTSHAVAAEAPQSSATAPGILVELFTSEGCSSCPPADALLRQLDSQPTISGSRIIVLGEHVDYWDRTGWRDRFSSHEYTDRQEEYARRFQIAGPYTPQIVVDGSREFVGNDARLLDSALHSAVSTPKAAIQIEVREIDGEDLPVKIEVGPLPANKKHADMYVAIADNADETKVQGGENSGRRLQHVAVLRILEKVTKLGREGGEKQFTVRLPKDVSRTNLRVIAFVQESGNGRVLGSAVKMLIDRIAIR